MTIEEQGKMFKRVAEARGQEWNNYLNQVSERTSDGGFWIPTYMRCDAPGLRGWLYRLFKDERGWEIHNPHAELIEAMKKVGIKVP